MLIFSALLTGCFRSMAYEWKGTLYRDRHCKGHRDPVCGSRPRGEADAGICGLDPYSDLYRIQFPYAAVFSAFRLRGGQDPQDADLRGTPALYRKQGGASAGSLFCDRGPVYSGEAETQRLRGDALYGSGYSEDADRAEPGRIPLVFIHSLCDYGHSGPFCK